MNDAFERLAIQRKLSGRMLEGASHEGLAECTGSLALNIARHRSGFGDLLLSDSLDLLARKTVDDSQANWLADGMEMIVGELGTLEEEKPKHQAGFAEETISTAPGGNLCVATHGHVSEHGASFANAPRLFDFES